MEHMDNAQARMMSGAPFALELLTDVNFNMSRSHYHTYFELYFLDAGNRLHMMNDDVYETRAGDFMLFAPYTMHHSFGKPDAHFSRAVIYFKPEVIQYDTLRSLLLKSSGLYRPAPQQLHEIRRFIYRMLDEQDKGEELSNAYIQSLLNSMLIQVSRLRHIREDHHDESRMEKVIQYIHENFEHEITLKELSDHFYISEYYLCREFKKHTNRTIIQYIQNIRIMHAQRLFIETGLNVTNVASQTGFNSLTHFNRVFREVTGMTPSAFRRQAIADSRK